MNKQQQPIRMSIVGVENTTVMVWPTEEDHISCGNPANKQVFRKHVFDRARVRYAKQGADGTRYGLLPEVEFK